MMRFSLTRAVAVLGMAGALFAQDDGPGRGVARLSLLSGDVSVRRGDTGEWVAGAANGPLVVGDRVQSGVGSRAEVQFDWANLARLSSNTELRLAELEQGRYQMELARGTVTFVVLRESSADADLNTPSVSVRPLKRGIYRVTVRDGDGGPVTEIAVRSGEVDVFSPRGSQRLRAGRTMLVRGAVSDPEFQTVADLPDDDWDRWNERRNRELLRSSSYNYVSRDVYGADDLDDHGTWVNSPPYGWVWQPRVAPGWAPYRYGRWSWVDYYGWSWVSYDPWGWAPYHYGRWFWNANRWCWWPGGLGRQWWRPGLVAWVGWGGVGVGVGLGGWGRVGWIPLAPYEPFYPWYGRGWYGRGWYGRGNTTIVNNINITNVYRNARVNDGVTVVQAESFGRGQSVRNVGLAGGDFDRASSMRGPVPIAPERDATRFSDRSARAGADGAGNVNDRFYSRREPARIDRVPFEEQRRGDEQRRGAETVARSPEAPASRGREAALGNGLAASPERGESRQVGSGGDGWRRVGDSSGRGRDASQEAPRTYERTEGRGSQNGWQRFGEPSRESGRESGRDASAGRTESRGGSQGRGDTGWRTYDRSDRNGRDYSDRSGTVGRESNAGRDRSESLQVNPPVVRDRGYDRGMGTDRGSIDRGSMDRGSYDRGSYDRGSSRTYESPRSGPRMESPRMEAPRMERGGGGMSMPRSGGSMSTPRGGGGMDGGMSRGGGGGMSRGGGMESRSPSGGGASRGGGGGESRGGGGGRRGGN
jgi:hypothetical protein